MLGRSVECLIYGSPLDLPSAFGGSYWYAICTVIHFSSMLIIGRSIEANDIGVAVESISWNVMKNELAFTRMYTVRARMAQARCYIMYVQRRTSPKKKKTPFVNLRMKNIIIYHQKSSNMDPATPDMIPELIAPVQNKPDGDSRLALGAARSLKSAYTLFDKPSWSISCMIPQVGCLPAGVGEICNTLRSSVTLSELPANDIVGARETGWSVHHAAVRTVGVLALAPGLRVDGGEHGEEGHAVLNDANHFEARVGGVEGISSKLDRLYEVVSFVDGSW